MQQTLTEIINHISTLPHVTKVTLWAKAEGKERLYIDTAKFNGGKTWNGGKGYATLYVDIAAKTLVATDPAGAATRDKLMPTLAALTHIATTL